MFLVQLIQHTIISFTLATTFGVFIHDTKIDQATSLAVAIPMALMGAELSGQIPKLSSDGHPHVERVSLENAVRDLHKGTPRVQPRNDQKKFHLQKHAVKGVHAFDGYYAPLGAI